MTLFPTIHNTQTHTHSPWSGGWTVAQGTGNTLWEPLSSQCNAWRGLPIPYSITPHSETGSHDVTQVDLLTHPPVSIFLQLGLQACVALNLKSEVTDIK